MPTSYSGLKDYKFFCFSGRVLYVKVDFDRFVEHHANYYDSMWNIQNFGEIDFPPRPDKLFQCPRNFHDMKHIAERLASGHEFLRVDLYNINGKIYFGELTFYPASGFGRFTREDVDFSFGKLLSLPPQKRTNQ